MLVMSEDKVDNIVEAKAPRILHIIGSLDIGGGERFLLRLLSLDELDKIKCTVISLTDLGFIAHQLSDVGVTVYALGMKRFLFVPFHFIKLVRLIKQVKPDIVQTWLYHADFFGGIAAKFAGVKHVSWGLLGTEISKSVFSVTGIIRKACALLSYVLPSKIMCVAESTIKTHRALGYCDKKMQFFHNGLDFSSLHATETERTAFRLRHGMDEKDIVIGSLGRFNPLKDHYTLIRAAEKLITKIPNVRFLIIGRELTPLNEELMGWINQTGLRERFILLGESSKIPVCLAAMDIFCLHSRAEGLPTVLAEAMAMGLPCVSTDVGDAGILMGEAGVLVEKQNPEALADGLLKLLYMTPEERLALGSAAQKKVKTEYAIEQTQQEFSQVYDSLFIKKSNSAFVMSRTHQPGAE